MFTTLRWIALGWGLCKLLAPSAQAAPGQAPWQTDLLVRAYAQDWVAPAKDYPSDLFLAAQQAAAAGWLPIGWLLDLASQGVPSSPKLAGAILLSLDSLGPPPNTLPATLAAYRAQVLQMAAKRLGQEAA